MKCGDYYADYLIEWRNPLYVKGLIPITMHVTDSTLTAINKVSANEMFIYPNPVDDLVTIQVNAEGAYSLTITSLGGRVINHIISSRQIHELDLSPYPKGIYFITIRSKDFIITEKIIKIK